MSAPYRSCPPQGIGRGGGRPDDPGERVVLDIEADELPGAYPLAASLAALDVDPVTGYILAPLIKGADGKVSLDLDALPRGIGLGVIEVADAPQGARNATATIDGNWVWRLVSGEGWAVREGKGPERSNGTRPKLTILEPCASVTLRAVGIDAYFPIITHHVVLAWVRLTRGAAWKAEAGWAGSTEPGPAHRRVWRAGPRRIGVTACKAVLRVPPDARVVDAALAAAPSDATALDIDQDVST